MEFCSEGAYSLADMESVFSELAGRKVTSAFISDADFLANAHKAPDRYEGQTLLTMFRHYNANSFCGNAFTLTQILGRKPIMVRDLEKSLDFYFGLLSLKPILELNPPAGKNRILGRSAGGYHAGTDPV